jgi:hypothetical protein
MGEQTTNATAPAVVTTTVQQPHAPVQALSEKSFTGTDVAWLLGFVAVVLTIVGSVYKMVEGMRARNERDAAGRSAGIMEAIREGKESTNDHMRALEEKLRDRDTALEKDLDQLRIDKEHYRNNIKQRDVVVDAKFERMTNEVRDLHTRMVTQEEKTRTLDGSIKEIKELIREKMDETKEMIRDRGESTDKKIGMLETTIREMSKRTPTS